MNSYEDPALSVECDLRHGVDRLAAENAALKEQLAEAERDAARYRWLRAQPASGLWGTMHLSYIGLDVSIDDAMQEREP